MPLPHLSSKAARCASCTFYQQAATTLECLAAEHVGQPVCCATLRCVLLSMLVTCVAVMPCQLKASGASIHSLPPELLGQVFAGVEVQER